ncbi:hypothetical protein RJ639_019590 [Escallonia herrerae]|uniref:Uncharacterized protein n=1 Tax=Escallonia herrerae TaxID=1293975 RepID=A0AA88V895_9ASTE|nr:hypothetical protein RJ639_019590 [Escallonia herrerae]
MAIDGSFKKPGSIPFKWEIRPGVPKVQEHQDQQQQSPGYYHHYSFVQQEQQQKQKEKLSDHDRSFPSTPQKLRPPPGGLYFPSPPEHQNRSSRSTLQSRSQSLRRDRPNLSPEIVSSGCFINPLLRRKYEEEDQQAQARVPLCFRTRNLVQIVRFKLKVPITISRLTIFFLFLILPVIATTST